MRILFVAMPGSVHTTRWISQLTDQSYDVHLFPSKNQAVHPAMHGVALHFAGVFPRRIAQVASIILRLCKLKRQGRTRPVFAFSDRSYWLAQVIRRIKPDLVHSLEIQHAGYLTLAARERLGSQFPAWIVTNWGSDIYLFGRLAEHRERIRAVLSACDYYSCECERDVRLAKAMGLKGEVLPVLPNTGGFDLAHVARFREPGPTSARRLIVLKGYQHFAGRALVGLRAIALCADELQGYRVAVYSASRDVRIAAELVANSTGIPIDVVSRCSHDDILRLHGRARVYIGLSISDGISTSLLEAITMGAFPIQSCTACVDEWIVDGETGLSVPPEDPATVAAAIRRAVSDDALVDHAATQNERLAAKRLDKSVIQQQVVTMYEGIAAQLAEEKGH